MLRVRDRRLEPRQTLRGSVEVVECFLRDERGDLGAVAAALDRLVHDEEAMRLPHRAEDRLPVERYQRAHVDHLCGDALVRELRRGIEREQDLARQVTIVRSVPARLTSACPSGTTCSPSGTGPFVR